MEDNTDGIEATVDSINTIDIEELNKKSDKKNEQKFLALYDEIYPEVCKAYKELKLLKSSLPKLRQAYIYDMKQSSKSKLVDKKKNKKKTGFTEKKPVPTKLLEFLDLEEGTELSRTDVGRMISGIITERGLKSQKDGRVWRADKEIKELFDLDDDVNKLNDPRNKKSLSIYTLQTHMKKLYDEEKDKHDKQDKEEKKKKIDKDKPKKKKKRIAKDIILEP